MVMASNTKLKPCTSRSKSKDCRKTLPFDYPGDVCPECPGWTVAPQSESAKKEQRKIHSSDQGSNGPVATETEEKDDVLLQECTTCGGPTTNSDSICWECGRSDGFEHKLCVRCLRAFECETGRSEIYCSTHCHFTQQEALKAAAAAARPHPLDRLSSKEGQKKRDHVIIWSAKKRPT